MTKKCVICFGKNQDERRKFCGSCTKLKDYIVYWRRRCLQAESSLELWRDKYAELTKPKVYKNKLTFEKYLSMFISNIRLPYDVRDSLYNVLKKRNLKNSHRFCRVTIEVA